ncbi:MAG TPA: DUF624 domain-containing protein [Candidatus Acetatifactor stercoripullorum]|uniref:DUF624 domain-containing protein n=1 Tax=Candidatus Acetatifactor stercoripullorum TaxID=2838414 RepID=A0A9D1UBS7_9FIRM|nr:DUF624 domain-containing protein [Candidatus Acetatifactor stercoripullorum]HIW80836.1 DUF624 domain-containing protein [Candidatus Acetatifactor stercoripullorum]
MKIFDLDSPLMQFLNKMADLLWLNILTFICCIPIVTIGASLTAMHYMALKMVRNEECYITRGFFKSFKENFRQATLIWLLLLLLFAVLLGDFYIMRNSGMEFPQALQIVITAVGVLVLFTATFVFPVLAKFENTIYRTLKNALIMSILQFPKTIAMLILGIVVPIALYIFVPAATPVVFLFGLSVPAFLSALMYNKFFKKLEAQMEENSGPKENQNPEEDERIFKDELDETLIDREDRK